MSFVCVVSGQEEEDKAFGLVVPEEDEEVEPQSANESDSDASSGGFGFASTKVARKEAKPEAPKSRKRTGETSEKQNDQAEKPGAGASSGRAAKAAKKGNPDDTNSSAKLIEKAESVINFFEAVDTLAMWNGSTKQKDLDAKMNKGHDFLQQLGTMSQPEAKEKFDKLKALLEDAGECVELYGEIRGKISAFTKAEHGPDLELSTTIRRVKEICNQPDDTFPAILADIARALTEARAKTKTIQFDTVHVCYLLPEVTC